ncbi:MAG: vWA domain-containing protein [Candidatus Thorarchaeota archaeon]
MILRARQGRYQQGICFVSPDIIGPHIEASKLTSESSSLYADVKISEKVPEGTIVLDTRIFEMLNCEDGEEIDLNVLNIKLPYCSEINLDVISNRELENHTIAQAISRRIEDFKDHFEGLVLSPGQQFSITELGVTFVVRHLDPTESTTNAARIKWKNLLKIHLGATEFQPSNLCIISEVAAATQIADIRMYVDDGDEKYITRHQAILNILDGIQLTLPRNGNDVQFAGIAFSDEVVPFTTFDSQTGEESEISTLFSSAVLRAFGRWMNALLDKFSNRPSNPGEALKYGLDKAQAMSEINGLPTAIVLFSSGVYSAGQNPVKVTRINLGDKHIKFLTISVGKDSATDIMEAIAKEGKGTTIHMDAGEKMKLIVDSINRILVN